MSEATKLGPVGVEERMARLEAALHSQMDAIATKAEEKVLGNFAEIVARHELPDRSNVPDFVDNKGQSVVRLTRPWDESPERMRLPEQERKLRTWDGDFWTMQWMRAVQNGDFAGRLQSEAKIMTMFPQLYRGDTLEGAADTTGGFAAGTGGVLLPRNLETLVTIALGKVAKFSKLARIYTMTAQEHNIPTAAAATAYMQGEATSPTTGGEPTLAQKPLVCHEAIGKLILGRDLLDDEAANVVPIFVQLMGDALGQLEDEEFLKDGTGSAPHVTKLSATAYAEPTTAALRATDVVTMFGNLGQRYRTNGKWIIASDVLGFMRNVRDGFGRFFYQGLTDQPGVLTDDDVQSGRVGNLMNKPAYEMDLTAGDIYFGDPFRNYAVGRRRGITVEMSKDFYFDTRRVIWLVSQRIAGNNIDTSAGLLCAGITSATSL